MNKEVIYIEPEDDITDIITKVKQAKEKVVALVPPKKAGILHSAVNMKLIAKTAKSSEKNVVIITTDTGITKLAISANLPIAKSLSSRPVLPAEAEAALLDKKPEDVISDRADAASPRDINSASARNSNSASSSASASDDSDDPEAPASSDAAPEPSLSRRRAAALTGSDNNYKTSAGSDDPDRLTGSDAADDLSDADANDSSESRRKSSTDSDNPKTPKSAFPLPSSAKSAKDQSAKSLLTSDELASAQDSKSKKPKSSKIPDLEKYRKFIIAGAIALILIVVFAVWAFAIAPAATITVTVKTTGENFSELVNLTTNKSDEDAASGRFYLQEVKDEQKATSEFKATGTKDNGAPATGKLTVTANMTLDRTEIYVPAGTRFIYDGLAYTNNNAVNFIIDEEEDATCSASKLKKSGCTITAALAVTAVENGEKYNIGAHSSGWTTSIAGLSVANVDPFSGGSSQVVTVVQQSDVDNALNSLETSTEATGLATLKKKFSDDIVTIDSSYAKTVGDPVVTPAVGAEVPDGTTPKIEVTTTYSMYGVEKSAIKEYIKAKAGAAIASDQKLYSLGTPFFENFDSAALTARLKTTVQVGPKVSESDILEQAKGRKVGEVQSLLKSIEGVNDVKIETSYFWVGSVPDDPNKVTVDLTINK